MQKLKMNNKIHYIYKITNKTNGKFYIGKHSQLENESFINYYGSGKLINAAIKKYGKNNFIKEIIEVCEEEKLDEREKYWINYYNATKVGYNLSLGGEGGNSTLGTKVYTDGKNKTYIRQDDVIPKGFYLGVPQHSIEQRIKMSISMKGKNKNNVPWNKGRNISDYRVKQNAYNAKQTMIKNGILKGANNPRAKTYIFIDPNGNKYEVIGNLRNFCKDNNISMNLACKFVNKGKIVLSPYNSHKNKITLNSVGWQIYCEENKDFIKEAKIRREKLRENLYNKKLLTKRLMNINNILKFVDLKQADKR